MISIEIIQDFCYFQWSFWTGIIKLTLKWVRAIIMKPWSPADQQQMNIDRGHSHSYHWRKLRSRVRITRPEVQHVRTKSLTDGIERWFKLMRKSFCTSWHLGSLIADKQCLIHENIARGCYLNWSWSLGPSNANSLRTPLLRLAERQIEKYYRNQFGEPPASIWHQFGAARSNLGGFWLVWAPLWSAKAS